MNYIESVKERLGNEIVEIFGSPNNCLLAQIPIDEEYDESKEYPLYAVAIEKSPSAYKYIETTQPIPTDEEEELP
jgi:hypothetical protein